MKPFKVALVIIDETQPGLGAEGIFGVNLGLKEVLKRLLSAFEGHVVIPETEWNMRKLIESVGGPSADDQEEGAS